MAVDFLAVLAEKRELVWRQIEEYLKRLTDFPSFCRPSSRYSSLLRFHQKIVSEYPQRKGKYFRPTLVLLVAEAMGFPVKKALKTAAAMQVSEDWILNHDDIEDSSLQRRGKPTLHRLYGTELALNAGDALHVLMWQILKDNFSLVGQRKALLILEEFCTMLQRTILGQTAEIKWTQESRTDLTDGDILFILESKTVYYTVAGPMRLGAILAGANQRQLEAIYEFARPVGYCFQIKDDLLDLTSDFAGLKKQQGNDIYEGKRTLMLLHLFRTLKGKNKKKLVQIMNKPRQKKTAAEVKWVIRMMEKYGSLAYGQKLAGKFAAQAEQIFAQKLGFLSRQPAKDQLRAGIEFVLQRKY